MNELRREATILGSDLGHSRETRRTSCLSKKDDTIVTDSRRYPRFKLELDVTVRSKTLGLIPGMTIEVSESGMSTILPVELPVGETVELHISLPLGSVELRAVVRNRNAFRYGFEFADHKLARKLINEHTEVQH
jgi:hypothetical protein